MNHLLNLFPPGPSSNNQDFDDDDITILDDEMPNAANTTTSTGTSADTTNAATDTPTNEAFMQTFDHSQPWPREPAHTLPQDIVECINDQHTSGELETLLQ
jgi:hypothetical protein